MYLSSGWKGEVFGPVAALSCDTKSARRSGRADVFSKLRASLFSAILPFLVDIINGTASLAEVGLNEAHHLGPIDSRTHGRWSGGFCLFPLPKKESLGYLDRSRQAANDTST